MEVIILFDMQKSKGLYSKSLRNLNPGFKLDLRLLIQTLDAETA